MRLFTHQLHNPATNRHLVPPASMWRELRERLDRLAHTAPKAQRLRVQGVVDMPESDVQCSLCVVVNGEMERIRDIGSNGRFRLDLPATGNVRLVFVQVGYLPRVVEIRPARQAADSSAANAPQRLDLRVSLTRSASIGGTRMAPLRERITLGHGRAPLLVEYDREPRGTQREDFWPLLKRAS
jgi:hypothetical protein